jgi:hypothetical protein
VPAAWIPHVLYSHLVLQDYLGSVLPEKLDASTGDKGRQLWSSDPKAFDQGLFQPSPYDGTNASRRWPYSSSFQVTSASYDNMVGGSATEIASRISQAGTHSTYFVPGGCNLGNRKLANVEYPAQKVHMHDQHARHFGKTQLFFGYPNARVVVGMMDNASSVRLTQDCNKGWNPIQPTSANPMMGWSYSPSPLGWEPNNSQGSQAPEAMAAGYYRWTRGFNSGVDFLGKEIFTGQPWPPP